jgi:hypothetical protein
MQQLSSTHGSVPPHPALCTALQKKIFMLFDGLILLKAGSLVYQGPADGALQFFADVGFPLPGQRCTLNGACVRLD